MTDTIKTYLTKIQIGAEQSYKNLSIFPLVADYYIPFDYRTLDDALSKDLIEVLEIRQKNSTPMYKVTNKSDQMILIHEGEKLVKAEGQRNVGNSIMIPAQETVVVPARLIEKNRWSLNSNPTRCFEKVKKSQDYLEHFASVDSQVGALFVINGKVAGMDCFGKPDILEKIFMKILESYAQDAAGKFDPKMHLKSSKAEAIHFLQMAKGARVRTKGPAKLGTGCRLESKMCSGFALAHENNILSLSVMAKN